MRTLKLHVLSSRILQLLHMGLISLDGRGQNDMLCAVQPLIHHECDAANRLSDAYMYTFHFPRLFKDGDLNYIYLSIWRNSYYNVNMKCILLQIKENPNIAACDTFEAHLPNISKESLMANFQENQNAFLF